MISPQLRAMRLRAVNNKRLAYLRAARKEARAISAELAKIGWYAFDKASQAQTKVKYDG